MMQRIEPFKIYYQGAVLTGQRWSCSTPKKTILIMHGAGNSNGRGFNNLQRYLGCHNYETIVFDFLGHGDSEGHVKNSSLNKRAEQALAVIHALDLHRDLNIMGFSMGAHNAIHVTAKLSVKRLCLAIPAVYSVDAEAKEFGPIFTSCIRRNRSWESSRCFSIIEDFKGKLLIISAEKDSVIPAEIPYWLTARARSCVEAEHHCIRNAGHDLSAYFELNPASRFMTLNSILRWLE